MDFFNALPDNLKRQLLNNNPPFVQNPMTQLLSQEIIKAATQSSKQKVQQTPTASTKSTPVMPNLVTEQLFKNVAALKAVSSPSSTSQHAVAPAQQQQPPKPKSALSMKYRALKDELARDKDTIRKVQRNRFDNTKAKEFFCTKERITEDHLKAIAEYCEIEVSDIKRSKVEGIPMQRMWWKRFHGKRQPKGLNGEELVQPNFPLKSLDENLCSNSSLQLVIQYLLSRNSGPIKGQAKDFDSKLRELDPRLNETFLDIFDDSQPLMSHVVITDDLIHKQEERLAFARQKLEEFSKKQH